MTERYPPGVDSDLGSVSSELLGAVAQLVARFVRIEKVRGSIPLSSTSRGASCVSGKR
jgi:hypothetical protein